MTKFAQFTSYVRIATLSAGLFLPALTLIPLGSLWLWQNGYILHWAVATVCLVSIAFVLQMWFLNSVGSSTSTADTYGLPPAPETKDPSWTPAEDMAWADVVEMARTVDVKALTSREAFIKLGTDTVRIVAKRVHPGASEPVWQFTVPEAFAIIERVSGRLGRFTTENIPLSDRLTVAQAMALYEWRGVVGIAEKSYELWRLIRLVNPMTAATQELRERLSRQMMQWGRMHVTQRLAYALVTEVGRAAIDLYGGRLRISTEKFATSLSEASRADQVEIDSKVVEPLRILIGGQTGAGKSSLVNALAAEVQAAVDILPTTSTFATYQLSHTEFPSAYVIDSPGLGSSDENRRAWTKEAIECDLILWVVPAHRADREFDRRAIETLRSAFAARSNRRIPPLLLILTHIDKLRPFQDWSPPYDLDSQEQPKAVTIRSAIIELGKDLAFDPSDVVPISLLPGRSYNIEALWSRMLTVLPDAKRAQLLRRLHDTRSEWDWQKVWLQAVGAGRVLGSMLGRSSIP